MLEIVANEAIQGVILAGLWLCPGLCSIALRTPVCHILAVLC